MTGWVFENVKEGDDVVVTGGGWNRKMSIATVSRVLKLHIVVGGLKYRRSSGVLVGGDAWSSSKARPMTEELRAEVEADVLRRKCANMVRRIYARVNDDLSLAHDELVAVCRALNIHVPE